MATNTKPVAKKVAAKPVAAKPTPKVLRSVLADPADKPTPAKKAAAPKAEAPAKTKAEIAAEAKVAKEAAAAKEAAKAEKAAAAAARKTAADAKREEKRNANEAAKAEVVRLRAEGNKWPEIAAALGISLGKAQLLGAIAEGEASGVKTATPAMVVNDRDVKHMSWVAIAVQYGLSKAGAQKLYRDAGKDPNKSYVGKGGRYFSHETDISDQRAAFASARPASTPRQPREKAEPGTPVFAEDAAKDAVVAKLDGKIITITSGTSFKAKAGSIKVGTNKGVRIVQATDVKTGGTRTVKLLDIVKIGK